MSAEGRPVGSPLAIGTGHDDPWLQDPPRKIPDEWQKEEDADNISDETRNNQEEGPDHEERCMNELAARIDSILRLCLQAPKDAGSL